MLDWNLEIPRTKTEYIDHQTSLGAFYPSLAPMNINCFSRKYSAPNLEIYVTRNEKNSLSSHWNIFAVKKNSDFDFSLLNILRKCMEWVGDSYYDLWGPRNTVKNGNISLSPENRLKLRSNAITSLNVYNHIVQFIFFKR